VDVTFAADSRLSRIERSVFHDCSSLPRLAMPSSVEFVGRECFGGCDALVELVFVSPAHIRKLLDVPLHVRGPLQIPDSAEVVRLVKDWKRKPPLILEFGCDSRLSTIVGSQV
jgi:hypothetical protein